MKEFIAGLIIICCFFLTSCEPEECCDCTAIPGESIYCRSDFPEDGITWRDRRDAYITLGCECD